MDENTNVGMEQVDNTETNVETTATDVENKGVETTENTNETPQDDKGEKKPKTFTQEQLDQIIRERIERERNSTIRKWCDKYGVNDEKGLDDAFLKSLSYDTMKQEYESIKSAKQELEKELAFVRNNIEPTKQEDVMAHFKGKDIVFNEENLKAELSTHPEWLKVKEVSDKPTTTIKAISPDRQDVKPERSEKEEMEKLFGMKLLDKGIY